MPYERELHEREAALLRWKAVLPRTSCGVHFVSRLTRVARLCATALALSREEAQYGRLPRARAAPRRLWSLYSLLKGTARARGHSSSVQGRALTCQPQRPLREPACACSALLRHCAASLCGGRAIRALASRVRCAAPAVVAPRPMKGHCTSEGPPLFGARPCSHMPAMTCTS